MRRAVNNEKYPIYFLVHVPETIFQYFQELRNRNGRAIQYFPRILSVIAASNGRPRINVGIWLHF